MLNCTPNEYILNHRLQIAVQKLIDTDISILNLATNLGFGSSSYFSKRFKEQYAYTPNEFRSLHQIIAL
jgi:AraC family transcriptional regulator